jgi:pyruvate/2-oxoglutarate dehydrogenase complex dihydrolipoamide dehydrogenase (E3) component
MTSDTVLGLTQLPRTMVVVGAGVIGIEYASMFAAHNGANKLALVRQATASASAIKPVPVAQGV